MIALVLLALAQQYRFPIERPGAGETQPYITAYRDHDGGGGLQDWSCGDNTYNGHRGTDIGIGGFAVMDNGSRWVVAAADGEVTYAVDGCFDRCTSGSCDCGGGFGNYVQLTHADGKRTYYGHLMEGSIQVSVGAQVTCGQRLGKVASSGNSTGPHLHFEPRYANNTSDDPFAGPCGGPESFWVAQGDYNDLPEERCEGGEPPPPPPPELGVLKGVVWDLAITAAPNAGGNVRIPGATLAIEGGDTTNARAGDAYWSFELAPGAYRITASAGGYESASRDVVISAGTDTWASIGLTPRRTIGEPDAPPIDPPNEIDPAERMPEPMPVVSADAPPSELEGGCACLSLGSGEAGGLHGWIVLVLLCLRRARVEPRTRAQLGRSAENAR